MLLLTGYLGSGKTTLVNRILSNKKGIKFAVIVNDIGEVNIDADLIQKGGVVGQTDDSLVPLQNGCICVGEISNMGCTPEAIDTFIAARVLYGPGKAVNAGGVATSGLEMTQNAMHISWSADEVDARLHTIMSDIHEQCVKYGTEPDGYVNYMKGANIAGFMKVAQAMLEQGFLG